VATLLRCGTALKPKFGHNQIFLLKVPLGNTCRLGVHSGEETVQPENNCTKSDA
jgi:hypothetical protein